MQSDIELIEATLTGDWQAFKELVMRYEGQVAGVAQSMLGKTPEAEDIGQEVFVRFYESLKKFRGEAALSTYLVRIAINLSLNELKRRKRQFQVIVHEEANHVASREDERWSLNELLQLELNRLEPEFKAVVTLRLHQGYSTEETAKILGIPLGTVLSRLARAQQKLRDRLVKQLK
ncbi:MAG: RNA polymerase sigma factor [Cytophagales bacterium]